jgi:uncharacterized protein
MPLLFNLRHLVRDNLTLQGELTAEELDLAALDELIHAPRPLAYDLEIEKMEDSVLVEGSLGIVLDCECARCLKPYTHPVVLENWTCHLPLKGEDKAEVINDCVDLTPYIREDILLAFPLHPLCGSNCGGLTYSPQDKDRGPGGDAQLVSSAWAELNKLKLQN